MVWWNRSGRYSTRQSFSSLSFFFLPSLRILLYKCGLYQLFFLFLSLYSGSRLVNISSSLLPNQAFVSFFDITANEHHPIWSRDSEKEQTKHRQFRCKYFKQTMVTLRLFTLLALTIYCSTVLAQNKPCEPCDVSKCPLVITWLIFSRKRKIDLRCDICRPWIKNVLPD